MIRAERAFNNGQSLLQEMSSLRILRLLSQVPARIREEISRLWDDDLVLRDEGGAGLHMREQFLTASTARILHPGKLLIQHAHDPLKQRALRGWIILGHQLLTGIGMNERVAHFVATLLAHQQTVID